MSTIDRPLRLTLVDGTFELYRAHYSKRPSVTSSAGVDVKATVGVALSLIALLREKEEAVTHLAVAFDNPIASFRNDLFAGYKSDEGVPPELRSQFDLVERVVRALGIVVWSMDRFEADDALATAATRFKDDVDQVRILTPDKDLGQVLDGTRVVQVDRIRARLIDEQSIVATRGIRPAQIPDFLALTGDPQDGIPGLAGFGEKTASLLLAQYKSIDEIPDDASSWPRGVRGAPRLAETLAAHRDDARLYKTLATLVRDVPLAESLADLEWVGARESELLSLAKEIPIETIRARVSKWR